MAIGGGSMNSNLLNFDVCHSWSDDFRRELYLGGELFVELVDDEVVNR